MNNITRVIKEVTHLIQTELSVQYGVDELLLVGIRFSDRSVDKLSCFNQELLASIFNVLDGKHPLCDDHKDATIVSIFICNKFGKTIYDSMSYKPSKQKILLRLDGDRKVLLFRGLKQEEKDDVVNKLVSALEVDATGNKQDDKKSTSWGEDMPWDFNK